ncbi:MAG: hypothetical protein ACYDAI_06545, partial [Trichloromonadaceae bacterium]
GRAKRAPQLPPPGCAGFPALRRGFGDRQKLAALRQFAGLIPKLPLRSGGGKRGRQVKSEAVQEPSSSGAKQFKGQAVQKPRSSKAKQRRSNLLKAIS